MTLYKGLKYTVRHVLKARKQHKPVPLQDPSYFAQEGLSTLMYPHESFAVPDNGRYRLHNEIDDCIMCDKCVKVCPVDCIDIEPVRATEEIGRTSDGTPKRLYAAKFDIDMGKCCFCGLCTTVCPTESLTMTKAYEFSEYDVKDHNYSFANMLAEDIEEKKQVFAAYELEKQKAKAEKESAPATATAATSTTKKPAFRPKIKPTIPKTEEATPSAATPKPKIKMKPVMKKKEPEGKDTPKPKAQAKPKMRPIMKPKKSEDE